ncbi:MAG: RDD family protein [Methylophilaceae bacterium]
MPVGVFRRLASAGYDGLLLLAVLFAASFVFLALFGDATHAPLRHIYQAYLYLVCATYFVGFWRRGGQTLAMRTWHIKLVSASGKRLGFRQTLLRFVLAPLGLLFFCWVWLDKERCFLHDRLANTRLVMT